jgi:multidrug resistance efflux pump
MYRIPTFSNYTAYSQADLVKTKTEIDAAMAQVTKMTEELRKAKGKKLNFSGINRSKRNLDDANNKLARSKELYATIEKSLTENVDSVMKQQVVGLNSRRRSRKQQHANNSGGGGRNTFDCGIQIFEIT